MKKLYMMLSFVMLSFCFDFIYSASPAKNREEETAGKLVIKARERDRLMAEEEAFRLAEEEAFRLAKEEAFRLAEEEVFRLAEAECVRAVESLRLMARRESINEEAQLMREGYQQRRAGLLSIEATGVTIPTDVWAALEGYRVLTNKRLTAGPDTLAAAIAYSDTIERFLVETISRKLSHEFRT